MKSNPRNLVKNTGSGKPKRKLSNKELPVIKKKSKKKEEEEKLPERYLRADELIFGKLLFERKGYRMNPVKRDGNCLFRAVAEQVYCDPNLFESLRNSCVDFMEEEEKWCSEFVAENFFYKKYLSDLRKDGFWGGNLEIFALSNMFNRPFEIYENSVKPKVVDFSKNQGNNIPPIRVCFRNKHYTTIRSDDVGDLFDFEGLKPGELEQEVIARPKIWLLALSYTFQDLGFLFGHGLNSFSEIISQESTSLSTTHNIFLQILFEFGLAGIVFFGYFVQRTIYENK